MMLNLHFEFANDKVGQVDFLTNCPMKGFWRSEYFRICSFQVNIWWDLHRDWSSKEIFIFISLIFYDYSLYKRIFIADACHGRLSRFYQKVSL